MQISINYQEEGPHNILESKAGPQKEKEKSYHVAASGFLNCRVKNSCFHYKAHCFIELFLKVWGMHYLGFLNFSIN